MLTAGYIDYFKFKDSTNTVDFNKMEIMLN